LASTLQTIEYRQSPPLRGRRFAEGLLPFSLGHALTGVSLFSVAVLGLGQWNSYIGRDLSLAFDSLASLGAAAGATLIVGIIAGAFRYFGGSRVGWRHPVIRAVAGGLCAVATFLPDIVDTHLTGVANVSSGNIDASGVGQSIGTVCFFICPLLISGALILRSTIPSAEADPALDETA
jgi:hypothetical protein